MNSLYWLKPVLLYTYTFVHKMVDVVLKSVTSSKLLISERQIVVIVHYAQTLETNPQCPRRAVVTIHSISILWFRCSMYSIAEPTAPFILVTCAVVLMNCKCTMDIYFYIRNRVVSSYKRCKRFSSCLHLRLK